MRKFDLSVVIFVVACTETPQANIPVNQSPAPATSSSGEPSPVASTVQTKDAPPQKAASQPSVDDSKVCHGTIDEALQHQLAGRAAQVRFCYERLLQREPRREGRLVVAVKLSGTGNIDNATVTLDELGDPETSECALGSFKEPLSGAIAGGDCAIANVPLRFKTKKADPATVQNAPPAQ